MGFNQVPLLIEGKTPLTSVAGTIVNSTYTVKTDRGDLKEIAPLVTNYRLPGGTPSVFLGNGILLTLSVGGQDILRAEPADKWVTTQDFGGEELQRLPVRTNQAQKLKLVLDGNDYVGPGQTTVTPLQYYTNEEREEFIQNLKWSNNLALKRQTFQQSINIGALAGRFALEGIIPRNNGPVIGCSLYVNADSVDVDVMTLRLNINGMAMILDVPATYFANFSQKVPFVFLYPFQPGSEFELVTNLDAVANNRIRNSVTFYFNG